jgi:hypothetical protein
MEVMEGGGHAGTALVQRGVWGQGQKGARSQQATATWQESRAKRGCEEDGGGEGGRLLAGLDKRLGVPGSPLGSLHGGDPRGESSTVMSPELEIRLRSGVRGQGSRSQIFCNPSSERSEVLRQRGPAGQPRLGTSGGGAFYSATHEDLHPVSGR